jgi:dUTP pyrophosphatase
MSKVLIKKLSARAFLPHYQTRGSSGCDVHAVVDGSVTIMPGAISLIKTGISIAMPQGYEAQVRSRSGLALKYGVFVLNSPGTVDNDYRGEVCVILCNVGESAFVVEDGMRIAQMVFCKCEQLTFAEVETLDDTHRGDGGFGSTNL